MRFAVAMMMSLTFVAAGCSSNASDTTATGAEDVAGPETSSPTGDPDLGLEELADVDSDAADAIQDIAGVVSIGDCRSETIGLGMAYVPEGWECRVLDQAVGSLDGFTLFKPQNPGGIEITVGTPIALGTPCEALQMCEDAEPIDLGTNFDMTMLNVGVPLIYGTHKTVNADAAVVMTAQLSDEDRDFITMVLNGVQEL